jgi:hypothetical protein
MVDDLKEDGVEVDFVKMSEKSENRTFGPTTGYVLVLVFSGPTANTSALDLASTQSVSRQIKSCAYLPQRLQYHMLDRPNLQVYYRERGRKIAQFHLLKLGASAQVPNYLCQGCHTFFTAVLWPQHVAVEET